MITFLLSQLWLLLGHSGEVGAGNFDIEGVPKFNPMMILHGEESVYFIKPIESGVKYTVTDKVSDIQDKGKGALLVIDGEIRIAETGEHVCTVQFSLFIRGLGGFGYKGKGGKVYPAAPKRASDIEIEDKTEENQAILYRLCNDKNPLHIDPNLAAVGGFDVPILHGLCFFGFTARICQEAFFKEDPNQLKEMTCRFTSHVFPGETLVVKAWKEGNTIIYETSTKERKLVVCQGYMVLDGGAKL